MLSTEEYDIAIICIHCVLWLSLYAKSIYFFYLLRNFGLNNRTLFIIFLQLFIFASLHTISIPFDKFHCFIFRDTAQNIHEKKQIIKALDFHLFTYDCMNYSLCVFKYFWNVEELIVSIFPLLLFVDFKKKIKNWFSLNIVHLVSSKL